MHFSTLNFSAFSITNKFFALKTPNHYFKTQQKITHFLPNSSFHAHLLFLTAVHHRQNSIIKRARKNHKKTKDRSPNWTSVFRESQKFFAQNGQMFDC
jgi:hypothetical protein